MPELLPFLLSGVTVGAVYALVALGFTIIYNASDVVNFAQGEFVMLGGMVTVFADAAGAPLPLAALAAVLVTAALGVAMNKLAIEPARGRRSGRWSSSPSAPRSSYAAARNWCLTSRSTAFRPFPGMTLSGFWGRRSCPKACG